MKDDYNLDELQQITVRDVKFNIMPRYLYHYTDKEYEEFSLDLINTLVTEGSTVLDIGSHYGIYSLLSAKNAKTVYAFEPVPENYQILKKNIADNELVDTIIPVNKAVSDRKGNVEFNVTWASDSAGFYEHPNAEIIRKIQVETASIDGELKDVRDISFIKIDTEGHELHVLDGLKKTLTYNKQAKMLIEFNPECLVNAGTSSRALIEKILGMGYDIFALHEESRYAVRVTSEVSDEDILIGEEYLNLLCLPKNSWKAPLFASHSSDIGGAELVLLETVEALTHRKDTFVFPMVTLPGFGPLLDKFKHLPVALKVIPMHGWTNNHKHPTLSLREILADNSTAVADMTRVFNDFKPQVVLTNTVAIPWAAFVARAFGVPHVWSIHEFGDLDHGLDFDYGYDESMRYIDELSDRVLVNSEAVKKHVGKFITANKLQRLTLNVKEPVLSDKTPAAVYNKQTELKLINVGLITPAKGQLEVVRAVAQLRKAGHKTELALLGNVGDQAYLKQIKDYCAEHKLQDYVHIIGFKSNPFNYVSSADVFVMCSQNEAFGRVSVEAMLLGTPVVGTDSGGTRELITNDKTGYLYKPHDIKDLVAKILLLSDKKHSKQIANNAKQVAEKLYHNDYYDRVYSELFPTKVPEKTPIEQIFRDFLTGVSGKVERDRAERDEIIAKSQSELQKFSDEYNKVYAAYHEVSQRLESIRNQPAVKLLRKVRHVKDKLKGH